MQNYITFKDWENLKESKKYPLANGEIDKINVYYDKDHKFIDYLKIREIEIIEPHYVLLPKFFREEFNLLNEDIEMNIKKVDENKHFLCKMNPRDEQIPILDFFSNRYKKEGNIRGILSAAPGIGKTAMAIKIIHELKYLSLIVIPSDLLQDQWIKAIKNFTDLTDEDIAVLEGSKINELRNTINNKKLCIIKMQSLYSQIKNIDLGNLLQLYKEIGVVIYDECHTSGAAESYAKTSGIFNTNNIIGLTATPYRKGINEILLRSAIGEVIYKSTHQNLIPDVDIFKFDLEFTKEEIKKLNYFKIDYIKFLGIYNSILYNKDEYFEFIYNKIVENLKNNHNVTVLFATNKMIDKLYKLILIKNPELAREVLTLIGDTKKDELSLVNIEKKKLKLQYKKIKEVYDGRVKNKKLKRKKVNELLKVIKTKHEKILEKLLKNSQELYESKIKNSKVIISNFQLLREGFDKPSLSNIIYGSPRVGIVSVIQSIGRITRILEGKNKPLAQFIFTNYFLDSKPEIIPILIKNIKVEYSSKDLRIRKKDINNS